MPLRTTAVNKVDPIFGKLYAMLTQAAFLSWLHSKDLSPRCTKGSLPVTAVLGRYRHQSSKRTTVQNKKDPILGKLYATPT